MLFCYRSPLNIMNNLNLNGGNLDKCQINFQSKYQTRTPWGYLGVSETMMKTPHLYSWLRGLCHLILVSQDRHLVEIVCSWGQLHQDASYCSLNLAFQKHCFVGFKYVWWIYFGNSRQSLANHLVEKDREWSAGLFRRAWPWKQGLVSSADADYPAARIPTT